MRAAVFWLILVSLVALLPGKISAQHTIEFEGSIPRIRCASFSPDSAYFAASQGHDVIRVWSIKAKVKKCDVWGHDDLPVFACFFDKATLVSVALAKSSSEDEPQREKTNVYFSDVSKNGQRSKTISVIGQPKALSENGRFVVTSPVESADVLIVHDILKSTFVKLSGFAKNPRLLIDSVEISADGNLLAMVGEERGEKSIAVVQVWSIPKGKMLWERRVQYVPSYVRFSGDCKNLFCLARSIIGGWDSENGKEIFTSLQTSACFGLSRDCKFGIGTIKEGETRLFGMGDRFDGSSIDIWSVDKRERRNRILLKQNGDEWVPSRHICTAPDGRLFAVSGGVRTTNSVRIYEMPNP